MRAMLSPEQDALRAVARQRFKTYLFARSAHISSELNRSVTPFLFPLLKVMWQPNSGSSSTSHQLPALLSHALFLLARCLPAACAHEGLLSSVHQRLLCQVTHDVRALVPIIANEERGLNGHHAARSHTSRLSARPASQRVVNRVDAESLLCCSDPAGVCP
jgi:hypothetical protein